MPPPLRTSAPSWQSLDKPGPGARTTHQKGSGPAHFSLFTSCRWTFLPCAPLHPFRPHREEEGGRERRGREKGRERKGGRGGREEVWGRAPKCALDPQRFQGQPSSAGVPEVLTPGPPPPGRVSPCARTQCSQVHWAARWQQWPGLCLRSIPERQGRGSGSSRNSRKGSPSWGGAEQAQGGRGAEELGAAGP